MAERKWSLRRRVSIEVLIANSAKPEGDTSEQAAIVYDEDTEQFVAYPDPDVTWFDRRDLEILIEAIDQAAASGDKTVVPAGYIEA